MRFISICFFIVVLCFLSYSCGGQGAEAGGEAAATQSFILKVPIAFNSKLPGLGTTITYAADRVQASSGGNLKLKIYEPGKLVPPLEILDAVSTGKTDAGYATAGYWAGKMPAAPLFSAVPFGPEAGEYLGWMHYGNGMKLYQEMYDAGGFHVKVLVCGIIAPETSGWYRKEINSAADLKGLKIRFFGLGGQVLQKLGASVTLLSGSEIFPALEKKAIDATEFSMPAIDAKLGFYKIAKYNYFPGWHQQATIFEVLVNKDVWNKIGPTNQAILETACEAATAHSLAEGEAIQFETMMKNEKERGVKNTLWSQEMLDVFRKTWGEVVVEQSAKDPFFKKVHDDLAKFRAGYEIWKKHAFLPRK